MTQPLAYLLTNKGITLVIANKPRNISSDNGNFKDIVAALRVKDYQKAIDLADTATAVTIKTKGKIVIKDGVVYGSDGTVVHNALTSRMLQMIYMGLEVEPLMLFMERLERNPSYSSREQLFGFLEACDLPILADGRFLAYKYVRDDYYDVHSGTMLNTVGSVLKMDRTKVDDNPNKTCSAGLHVCSQGYMKFGEKLMHVAVDPEHVVAVPTDYNNSKMRVCEYEVLEEAPDNVTKSWDKQPVYSYACSAYEDESVDDEDEWFEDFNESNETEGNSFKAKLAAWLLSN